MCSLAGLALWAVCGLLSYPLVLWMSDQIPRNQIIAGFLVSAVFGPIVPIVIACTVIGYGVSKDT